MKTSTLVKNGVSKEMVGLISRLVNLIPWPERRRAMGDVTLALLDDKHRVAVEIGIKEFQTGISCINDISQRIKPRTEVKNPKLLAEIRDIMEPHSESDYHLRATLLYTNMTAKAVYDALVERGWSAESLPTVRTISNILKNIRNRSDLRKHLADECSGGC